MPGRAPGVIESLVQRVKSPEPGLNDRYLGRMKAFVGYFMRPPDQLTLEDIHTYQLHLAREKVSWGVFNQSVAALRFFYGVTLQQDWEWYFDVPSSEVGSMVTLSWEGNDAMIKKSFLINARTGQRVNVKPDGTYTFTMESTREGFWWLVGRTKPD